MEYFNLSSKNAPVNRSSKLVCLWSSSDAKPPSGEENIELNHYFQRVVSTLTPILKRKKAQVKLHCPNVHVTSYPGYHAQVLTNLITNSVQHGFDIANENRIEITVEQVQENTFKVTYRDNGKGIPTNMTHKVVEPFYTTDRISGSTGLGLSICHNLATNALNGSFAVHTSEQGTHIVYTFSAIHL